MDGSFYNTFITWLPLLLIVAFWFYFMRQMRVGKMTPYQKAHFDLTERQVVALERIAAELAKRNTGAA